MEEIEEEGFQNVVAVMAQHQRLAALFACHPVEMASAQARAQRAIGGGFRQLVGNDRIGVLIFDPVGNAVTVEVVRQDMLRKTRLPLIEIAGNEFDRQQAPPLEIEEQRQQAVGILAARQCHQPAARLAVFRRTHRRQHREILDRLARVADQPFAQLVEGNRGRRAGIERGTGTGEFRRRDIGIGDLCGRDRATCQAVVHR